MLFHFIEISITSFLHQRLVLLTGTIRSFLCW